MSARPNCVLASECRCRAGLQKVQAGVRHSRDQRRDAHWRERRIGRPRAAQPETARRLSQKKTRRGGADLGRSLKSPGCRHRSRDEPVLPSRRRLVVAGHVRRRALSQRRVARSSGRPFPEPGGMRARYEDCQHLPELGALLPRVLLRDFFERGEGGEEGGTRSKNQSAAGGPG